MVIVVHQCNSSLKLALLDNFGYYLLYILDDFSNPVLTGRMEKRP